MKKIFLNILLLITILILVSCGNSSVENKDTVNTSSNEIITESTLSGKTLDATLADALPDDGIPRYTTESKKQLEETISSENKKEANTTNQKMIVIYSSFIGEQYSVGVITKGNTEIVAEAIIENLKNKNIDVDKFKVEPKNDIYPKDSYKKLTEIASEEQRENARPDIKDALPDISKYDTIFVGAPVWWGDFPMLMYTLFENVDMNNKTIIPFSTHGGSGLSGFDSKLRRQYPNANVLKGLAISGTEAQNNKDKVKNDVASWINGLNIS